MISEGLGANQTAPALTSADIASHLSKLSPMMDMTRAFSAYSGIAGQQTGAAVEMLNGMVTQQSSVIAFLNDFRLMTIMTFVSLPLVLLLKKPDHKPTAEEAAAAME